MNTYRVRVSTDAMNRALNFDVDACHPHVAISRALQGLPQDSTVIASCNLYASDIERDWQTPKVRAV